MRPRLLGVPADPLSFAAFLEQLGAWIQAGEGLHQVCTVNPEFIVMAQRDPAFYALLQESALNVVDGWGAVWALRWRGVAVPERVTGSDGLPLIAARAAQKGWRLFFLGAEEGIAALAAEILRQKYPGLQIVGTYAGSPAAEEAPHLLSLIAAARPDMLFVAYGAPRQDVWIQQHRGALAASGVRVAMGVGGSFDFLTGYIRRAPPWMRDWGLEWLYRLYLQPSRWRRMLRLPLFVFLVLWRGDSPPAHSQSGRPHDNA
jgi:N-acetylglucosaminyldiphosphoundecaprenol N-acetyl-beta-D-mannosaminyltransferase